MTDAEVNQLLVATVDAAVAQEPLLADLAGKGLGLVQAYQPRAQGANNGPTFYFFKAGGRRYGFPHRANIWNADLEQFEVRQLQQYEARYQFEAQVPQNPKAPDQLTAHDALCALTDIMAGDGFRQTLQSRGVGMLRVTEVRNPYFTDDRDRFEANPSFDLVLTYPRRRMESSQPITAYDFTIKRV